MTQLPGATSASRWSARALRCSDSSSSWSPSICERWPTTRCSAVGPRSCLGCSRRRSALAVLVIPGQSREALGIELMPIALVYITLSALATFCAVHSRRGVSPDRLARFFFGELSAGLIFAGGLGLLVHALGGAYLVAAGVILGVLSAMLAIWTLFVGLGLEQREG